MKRLTLVLAAATLVAACSEKSTTTTPDVTAPTINLITPVNAASGIPRNPSVTDTFSEAMNVSTINTTTFVLMDGATLVPGAVTYTGTTATLVPTAQLAPNTVYTATISTGAKDVAGNPLAALKSWNFTTVATPVGGPAAVNLGTAGTFVILAKSAVSTRAPRRSWVTSA